MRKFHIGQRVGLMWEETPYDARGMLKIGTIVKLPSNDDKLFNIVGANPNEPNKVYMFFAKEMIDISISTLNGDVL